MGGVNTQTGPRATLAEQVCSMYTYWASKHYFVIYNNGLVEVVHLQWRKHVLVYKIESHTPYIKIKHACTNLALYGLPIQVKPWRMTYDER